MSRNTSYLSEGRIGPSHRRRVNPNFQQDGEMSQFPNESYNTTPSCVDSRTSRCGPRFYTYGPEERLIQRVRGVHLESAFEHKPDIQEVLAVRNVDLKTSTNSKAHRTNKFEIASETSPNPQLVVRRGQPFIIEVEFSKPYDPRKDDLKLVFDVGTKPLASKRTHVEFILSDEDIPGKWGAKIVFKKGNAITIYVFTPPDCFVAKWAFKIDVVKREDTDINVYRYVHKNPIYIIFNPWCAEDTVYMPEEDYLKEYILNETGKIYNGTKTSITSKPWNFGQFESCVLDVAMHVLDITGLNWAVRGNPIPVIRKLSAMVNSSDDGGILTGRWDDDYHDGTAPQAWSGSVAILEEYWRTRRPVNYGQCWVFAGIGVTICRALGIPARCVTNYYSAHDTDGSISIDVHATEEDEIEDRINDSIWNFHVWTEAWMARPDLPPGYGGWQVIDATPQEASDGVYCCGPTSVHAIQQGEVNLPYDGPFVFAEVNADVVYWQSRLTTMAPTYVDKKAIGKFISTKAPNSGEREDLTLVYKHSEDSAEERAAVLKANLVGSSRQDIYIKTANDVKFNIQQDSENTWLGGSFIVGLRMKNNSERPRTVSGRIVVSSMYYTGVTSEKLKSEPFVDVVLGPGEEHVQLVVLTQDEYDGRLKDGYMLDVSLLAHVKETNQNFIKKENYRLQKPHLVARAPAEAFLNKEFKVDVSFTNPLNSSLTNCSVTVDGVSRATKYPQATVPPNATFTASLPVVPKKVGSEEIIIIFNSKQLEDVSTTCPVNIREL